MDKVSYMCYSCRFNTDDEICRTCWSGSKYKSRAVMDCSSFYGSFLADRPEMVGTLPKIDKVVFNNPATIVLWSDKTKTIVKCGEGDIYDPEKGLAMAIAKKAFGNEGNYFNIFKKWVPKVEPEPVEEDIFKKLDMEKLTTATTDLSKDYMKSVRDNVEEFKKSMDIVKKQLQEALKGSEK